LSRVHLNLTRLFSYVTPTLIIIIANQTHYASVVPPAFKDPVNPPPEQRPCRGREGNLSLRFILKGLKSRQTLIQTLSRLLITLIPDFPIKSTASSENNQFKV